MNQYRGCEVRCGVRRSERFSLFIGFALAALVISGSAMAIGGGPSSSDDQYGAAAVVKPSEKPTPKPGVLATSATVTQQQVAATQQPVAAKPTAGSLPSTGISLAGTVVIGLGLAGV